MKNEDMYINRKESFSSRRMKDLWRTMWIAVAGIQVTLAIMAGAVNFPLRWLVGILIIQALGCLIMAYEYIVYEKKIPDFLWMLCVCSITLKAIISIRWPEFYKAADLLQTIAALLLIGRTLFHQRHQ